MMSVVTTKLNGGDSGERVDESIGAAGREKSKDNEQVDLEQVFKSIENHGHYKGLNVE